MSQSCIICNHPKRLEIDRKIVEGTNLKKIARDYEVPYHSLYPHAQKHVSRQLAKAVETRLMIEGNELLETITKIIQRAENIFDRNYKKGFDVTALKALDSQRNTIQLLSNISAQLHQAKMAELALMKEKGGQTELQAREEYQEKLVVFNSEELLVYQRLINKLSNQNDDRIIKNSRVLVYNNRLTK
jgi:hypothetical protein